MSGNPQTDPAFIPGQGQQLPGQIGLPSGPPGGSYTDAQYLASEAQLRQQISSQYADLLAQLGYVDPNSGSYIPGSVGRQAQISEDQVNQQRQQAILGNTQNAQQNGITFSGERGVMQAQAELPYWQQIGQLEYQVPETYSNLYNQASDLINQYHTQNSMLLADAANRALANTEEHPTPVHSPPPPTAPPGMSGRPPTTHPPREPDPILNTPPPRPAPLPGGNMMSDPLAYHATGLVSAIHHRLNDGQF